MAISKTEDFERRVEYLEDAGLTKNEARVYLALLENYKASVNEIAEASGVHRVNVYDSLEKLKQKGIINILIQNGRKVYQPSNPETILSLIEQKEINFKKILPELQLLRGLAQKETQVELLEGFAALKPVYNSQLEMKDEIITFGVPKICPDLYAKIFFDEWHKRRIALKLYMRHIYNSDAKERVAVLNKMPYTEAKFLDPEYDSPVSTRVVGDMTMLTLWGRNPIAIVIRNQQIASAYKKYFEFLWKRAHK